MLLLELIIGAQFPQKIMMKIGRWRKHGSIYEGKSRVCRVAGRANWFKINWAGWGLWVGVGGGWGVFYSRWFKLKKIWLEDKIKNNLLCFEECIWSLVQIMFFLQHKGTIVNQCMVTNTKYYSLKNTYKSK